MFVKGRESGGVITIESFELEHTSKGLLVQLPSMNRDTLQLHQVLRACPAQPDPEYPQDWASTTSLGNPCDSWHHGSVQGWVQGAP